MVLLSKRENKAQTARSVVYQVTNWVEYGIRCSD